MKRGSQSDRVRDRLRRKDLMAEVKESVTGGKMIKSLTIVLSYNSTGAHGLLQFFYWFLSLCSLIP